MKLRNQCLSVKEEEYQDYLVDKAKELLHEQMESDEEPNPGPEKPEMKRKRKQMDEKAEKDSTSKIPAPWDPQEIQHLVENRKKMDNEELEEFLRKDHELQEELQERDWTRFSRWEERFLIQNHKTMTPEEVATELDRDGREVELKMRTMGLKPSEP